MLRRSAPRRLARLRYIEQLDPGRDYEEIYRIITGYEFPWDYWQSLSLAFFRTFAVPSISGLLDHTGELVAHTKKRADDTLLLMYEIGRLGMENSEGRAYIRRMNRMHQRYDISNEDSAYIISLPSLARTGGWPKQPCPSRPTCCQPRSAVRSGR